MPKDGAVIRRLKVAYRDDARTDLDQIFWYLVETTGRTGTARDYALRLEDRCNRIGHAPHIGRRRDDLLPGLRTIAFEHSALICYVVEDDTVWITNVFRRGRDYEAILRGTPEATQEE